MKNLSIGMFDSGLGGLTVAKELMRVLPLEKIVYFGDTARLPYGDKSKETIVRYSKQNATFLNSLGIKILVVACGTSASQALQSLQENSSLIVVGTIFPGAKAAVNATKNGKIAVLATKGTIRSKAFEEEILKLDAKAKITPIAAPLLVPLIEEGFIEHKATELVLREYLKPIFENDVDTLVLGCTHYPLLKGLIENVVEGKIKVVDSAVVCAEEVKQKLKVQDLLNEGLSSEEEQYRYFVSADPCRFKTMAAPFLNQILEKVERVDLSDNN